MTKSTHTNTQILVKNWANWLLAVLLVFFSFNLNAQTTNCTTHDNSNGAGSVTFNVQNTNAYGVIITGIKSAIFTGTTGTFTFTLLYNTTPVNSSGATWTQGIVGAGQNGWQTGGTGSATFSVAAPPIQVLSGLNILIPPGATYGFGLSVNTNMGYQTLTAGLGVNSFSSGGVILKTGDNISWGGAAYPATPVNYPRGWDGCIMWTPAVPCTSPPTPGASTATPSSGLCVGQNITLDLSGNSSGTGQTYQWQSSSAIGGPYSNVGSSQSGSQLSTPATGALYYRCEVTCSGNSQVSTPVFVSVNAPFPAGTYTINSAVATGGTNFQTFNAFKNAVACGIAGPVVANVVAGSGPYTEQVSFPQIGGMSAINTITINGNGRTLTFAATLSTAPSTLELNGTDYMTVNNLIVVGTGATYAFACHLWNQADNNAFNNCTFTVPANCINSTQVPFSLSGSQTVATTTGIAGNNNIITGCTMNSGYYNICIVGNTAPAATGNQVINCNIRDQYFYGLYIYYQNGAIIRGNTVERPTRTTLSTFYGIYVTTGCINVQVDANRMQNPFGAAPTNTGTAYGVYISTSASLGNENKVTNNLIYNFNSSGPIYGIYMPLYTYNKFYHNTIAFDQTTATGTTTTYGIYAYGNPTDMRNNIITIRRGGTGIKYCLYIPTPTGVTSNNNDLYMNSAAGTNYIGYNGTSSYATLAAWQSASGKDAASVSVDPLYLNPGTGDYTPTNGLVNNIGANVGIATDINGSARTIATPDPGAYEFSTTGLDAGISWVSPVSPATAGLKTITVNIVNTQTTTITNLNLSYNDGSGPVTQAFSGLNILGGANQNFSFTTQYNLIAGVTMTVSILSVNGGADGISGNNTATYNICVGLSGTYTINSAVATGGTNYQTFTAAVAALTCGIAGPVVFNVAAGSGPYTEQVIIPVINGVSAVNNITFNGNGRTLTYNSSNSLAPSTMELNGADYIRINNLIITAQGTTYAFALHLWNQADNNIFTGCTFNVPANCINSTQVPFSISGSQTSATTTGVAGNNNVVTGCTIFSGYYNTCLVGNTSPAATGNQVLNCNIRDQYFYGMYIYYQNGAIIRGNIIERPTRTTLSTYYGIYLTTGCINVQIDRNRLRNAFGAAPTNTGTAYCLYIASTATLGNENIISNNLVSDMNSNGAIYGVYMLSYPYNKIYHNTLSFDQTAASGTTTTYGMYAYGNPTDIRNNIITIRRGGTGTKYGFYIPTPTGVTSNYNDLYLNASGGTNYYGYNGTTTATTFAAWQATGFDANSVSTDPNYFNPAGANYKPTSTIVDNNGTPVGVNNDITGAVRSPSAPDPGAYEFTVAPKDIGVFNIVSPAPTGCYANAETFVVTLRNYGTQVLDFSVDPVTVTCDITGQIIQTVSATVSSGTLAVGGTQNVSLSPTVDGTANGTYTINAYTTMAADGEPANNGFPITSIEVGTLSGTISSNITSICVSGSPVLTATGVYGGATQWQESTTSASGPWTNVGTNSSTYAPSPVTQTTYYQALTVCNTNTSTSNNVTVNVSTPAVISTAPGSHCGNGTVTLGATGSSGTTVSWYANSTGGTALGTGTSFTTPSLSSTTNYYAEAGTGAGILTGLGNTSIPSASGFNAKRGIQFDAYQAFTLESAQYYAAYTGTTNLTVELQNSAGTVLQTATLNIVHLSGTASWNTIPINFIITPGTGYKLLCQFNTGSLSNYSHSTGANYALPAFNNLGSVGLITNGLDFGPVVSTTAYYYFYNITVSAGCASPRTAVAATITTPPLINVVGADPAVCPGGSTTLSVNSLNDPNYTYAWTSNPSGFTASGAGPHTVSPTATTKYIVTATDNTAGPNTGCVSIDSVSVVTAVALVTGTASTTQTTYCNSGSPVLVLTGSDGGAVQWQKSIVSASGPWTNTGPLNATTYNAGATTQTTYFQAMVSCQSTAVYSNVLTVTVNSPMIIATTGATRCGYGPVTVSATGSAGTTLNWYNNSSGGVPLGTGNSFTTNVSASGNLYVSANTGTGGSANATMPAQLSTYSGWVRGYWFTAPSSFTITSINVPLAGTGQSIAVIKFTGATPPPTYSVSTNAFTTLFLTQNNSTTGAITCNISVAAGDVIGVLGQVGSGTTALTSYAVAVNPSYITIAGQSVGLTRMLMQDYLTTAAPHDISQEVTATSSIGRVEFTYTTGCESPLTPIAVTVNPAPAIIVNASSTSVCANSPITLDVSSSNAGYTYSWSANPVGFTATGPGPHTANPAAATEYTVTANDVSGGAYAGCGASGSVFVNITANPINLATSATPAAVCIGSNTQLNVNATVTSSSYCTPDLSGGTYGCTDNDYVANVTFAGINRTSVCDGGILGWSQYTTPNPTIQVGNTYTLSVTITPSWGEAVTAWIDWDRNGVFDATESVLASEVLAAGGITTANVIVPAGSYNGTTRLRVRCNYAATFPTSDACIGYPSYTYGETEDYNVTITGGIPSISSFTYLWSPSGNLTNSGISNPVAQNITANQTYTVTVSDPGTGCQKTGTVPITVKPVPDPSANSNAPICEGNPLGLTSSNNASGQSTGNSYAWSGPSFASTLQNPSVTGSATLSQTGTYTVTITNSFGCTASTSTVVAVNANPTGTAAVTAASCNGLCDGGVVITPTAGQSPYIFTDGVSVNTDGIFTGTYCAGPMSVDVFDDNGCTANIPFSVTEPAVLAISSTTPVDESCAGLNNGSITVAATGGTTSYFYSKDNGSSFQSSNIFNGLAPGNYDIVVKDAHDCITGSTNVTIAPGAPLPSATISGSQNICQPGGSASLSIAFTQAGPWTYSYSDGTSTFGPFSTSGNPETVNVSPASTKTYTVTTVSNGCVGSTTGSAIVTVSTAPPTTNLPFPTVPAYACAGNNLTASTSPVTNTLVYTWDGPAGTTFNSSGNPYSSSSTSVTVNYGAPNGSGYNICVQGSNACGTTTRRCTFVRGTVNVPGVIAAANNRTTECASTSASYSIAAVTGATGYTWSITGNATVVGSGTSATVNFGAGWTGGTLSVTANTPCFNSAPRSLALSNATATPGAISGSATACPGSSVTYSIPVVAGAATYNWVLPANTTGGSSSNSILVNFLTGFSFGDIKVSITSICGVTSVQKIKTVSSGLPALPVSISGNLSGLCGQTTTYNCPSVAGASSYTWTTPGTINSGQGSTSINASFASFVSGNVCVTANNSCGSGASRCVPVAGKPTAPAVITYSPNPICANQSGVDLQVAPVFGTTGYAWIFPAGVTPVLDLGNEQIVNWGPTGGTVTVTVSNACGNSSKNQTISLGCREIAPETEVTMSEVMVYPNPAHDKVTIQFTATEKTGYVLNLLDLSGRVISTANAIAQKGINTSEMDLSQLAKGVYMIEVKSYLLNKQIRIVIE